MLRSLTKSCHWVPTSTTDPMSYVVEDKQQILSFALMLQQIEVLLVALLPTLKSPPASMTADARLQQQVVLAALQMFTFIAPGLETTAETALTVSFVLALGFVVGMRTLPRSKVAVHAVAWLLIQACAMAPTTATPCSDVCACATASSCSAICNSSVRLAILAGADLLQYLFSIFAIHHFACVQNLLCWALLAQCMLPAMRCIACLQLCTSAALHWLSL